MVSIVGLDKRAVKRVTCRDCASKLEYTLSEVQTYTSHDYGGGSDTHHFIDCPKCSQHVDVKGY